MNKKRKREPLNFQEFVLTTTTSAPCAPKDINENTEMYFRQTAFFPVLDSLIVNLKIRFSSESLEIAQSIDNFFKFNFEKSLNFINHYCVSYYNIIYNVCLNIMFLKLIIKT